MRFEMFGERIERCFDLPVVAVTRRRPSEPRDPGRALAVVGKEPMHISPGDAPVGRDGAVAAAVLDAISGRAVSGPLLTPTCIS